MQRHETGRLVDGRRSQTETARRMATVPARPMASAGRVPRFARPAVGKGYFSVRLPIHLEGLDGKIADAFNEVVDLSQKFATELERISHAVGKDGRIHERMSIGEVRGAWAD